MIKKQQDNEEFCYYCKGSGYLMRTPKEENKSLVKCAICNGSGHNTLRVLVDGEWKEASPALKRTVADIEKALHPKR